MKIAFVCPLDLNLYSFRILWLKTLKDLGFEVYGILPKINPVPSPENQEIKILRFRFKRQTFNPFQDILTIYDLYRIFRKEHFYAIHSFTIKLNIYAAIAAKISKTPIVITQITGLGYIYTCDNVMIKLVRLLTNLLFKISFLISKKIIFQNNKDLVNIAKHIDIRKSLIIPGNGIDTNYYSNSSLDKTIIEKLKDELKSQEKIIVTLIARLNWNKGIKEFIDAALSTHKTLNNTMFLIIGWQDRGNPGMISDSFIKNHSCEFIKFLGKRTDIKELLYLTDIYVLPSYREGLANSILEAMSMNKPIITTNVPGCSDLVENGINGLLVPPRNSKKLAEAIFTLASDKKLRDKFGNESRNKVIQSFSNEIILDKVIKLYLNLLPEIKHKNNKLLIRKAVPQDALSIAEIHIESLPKSFLASLKLKILKAIYSRLIKYKEGIVFIAEYDGFPCGFIAGVANYKKFFAYYLKNEFFRLIIMLPPTLLRLDKLKKIFDVLFYGRNKLPDSIPEAELLSIAVRLQSRCKGVGKELFGSLTSEFKKFNINKFRIIVGKNLKEAKNFYEKLGCKKVLESKIHNNLPSEIHLFEIK